MQFTFSQTLLLLLAQLCPTVQAGGQSLGGRLEKLAPRAAGVALIEVLEINEFDSRPSDGPLYLDVRLRIIRGTGMTTNNLKIIKSQGGHMARNSLEFKPTGPVKVDTFKTGERYWIAYCSQYNEKRYPQRVVKLWPEKDSPKLLEEAIRTDHYANRPQYDPRSGFTHSCVMKKDKKNWRVRMERDTKLLWEVNLPGEKYKGERFDGEWRLFRRKHRPTGWHIDENRSGWFLFAETASLLEAENGYGLPAEKHRMTYALDADTGKTAAIWVSRMDLSPTATPSVAQYFDRKTGRMRLEERYALLEKGGVAAGAKEERWLRKLVRTYDPDTGVPTIEQAFRWVASSGGSKFVPVK